MCKYKFNCHFFIWSTYRFVQPRMLMHAHIASGCLQCDSVLGGEYACTTQCDEYAGNELCLSRTLTTVYIVLSLYLVYLKPA